MKITNMRYDYDTNEDDECSLDEYYVVFEITTGKVVGKCATVDEVLERIRELELIEGSGLMPNISRVIELDNTTSHVVR